MFLIPGSHVFPAAASNQSAPALHVDEIDWDAVPPEFKKEDRNWLMVSNPKTEKVLDISLVRILPQSEFVPSSSSVSTITRAHISCG